MQPGVISVTVTLGGYSCTGPGPRSPPSPVAPGGEGRGGGAQEV